MAFFEKIKDFFSVKEEKESILEVSLDELDSIIEKKKENLQSILNEKSDRLYSEILIILDKLEDDAKIVENVNIQDKKVEERIKNINEAGRKEYLNELYKFIENLRVKKEGEHEIIYITSELNKFLKNTQKSYYYATQVIGNEMKAVKDGIIKIEKIEEEFKKENIDLIKSKKEVDDLILKNNERRAKLEFNERLLEEIKETKRGLEETKKDLNRALSKIEELNSDPAYLKKIQLINEKDEKEEALKTIESNINILFDKKILEKYVYFEENKDKKRLALSYIKDSPQALLVDKELKILGLIDDIKDKIDKRIIIIKDFGKAINKLSIDKFLVEDYQISLKDILEEIKELEEGVDNIKVDPHDFLAEKSKQESYLKDLTLHLDSLTKKQEKSQQELDEMGNELIFRVKSMG